MSFAFDAPKRAPGRASELSAARAEHADDDSRGAALSDYGPGGVPHDIRHQSIYVTPILNLPDATIRYFISRSNPLPHMRAILARNVG